MYAVVKTGGKQYRVSAGEKLKIEQIPADVGAQITLDQILFMRPIPGWSRHAMPVDRLYLAGAGAHPGPGIPGGAGWLAARRVIGDRRRRG